jgi:putative ABC transport system permease protein
MSARPSRALVWLLRRLMSRAAADAAAGDILEVLADRIAAGRAPRWPALWMRVQLALAISSALRTAAPRLARTWGHTFREALRGTRRRPAQSLFIVLVLAVGMSAATVTFSVVDATVLRPLPFDEGDRIVAITGRRPSGPSGLPPEAFWTIHDHVKGLDSIAPVMQFGGADVTVNGATESLTVLYTTAGLFRVLRLNAFIGSVWTDDQAQSDPNVAVITHAFWHRRFGGDPAVLGAAVRAGKTDYRIIGVLAPGASFPSSFGASADVWVPGYPDRAAGPLRVNRISPLARLAPGVSIDQLIGEIESAIAPLAAANPTAYADWRVEARSWRDGLSESVRPWMLLALGSVCLVLLIACANAANVMLTRSWERARELAVRASLGASRRQLGAALLIESLSLAAAASLLAMLFASWGIDAAKTALPVRPFGWDVISLDMRVMTAGIAAALTTGLVCGIVPGWQASRVSVLTLLKDGGATSTSRRRGWRSVFLTAQVASVAALLVVSTLFIASFVRVITVDLGMDRSNLIGVPTLTGNGPRVAEYRDRLRTIHGVQGIAAVGGSTPPLIGSAFGGAYDQMKLYRPEAGDGASEVQVWSYAVAAEYFDVAGVPFRQGSSWPAHRAADASLVPIVIDEPTARKLFGEESPLGRLLRERETDRVFTIAGVAPYLRGFGPERTRQSSAYYPLEDMGRGWVGFFIRTSVPPGPVAREVHGALLSMARPGQWPEVHLVDDAFRRLTAVRRFNGLLMSLFAALAVIIGCAGVYAAMASAVSQRTREIGVRIALGATGAAIRRSVLADSGRYVLIGLAIGLPAGWLMSRSFGSIFFEVAPGDLSVHALVAAVLVTAGLAAAVIPARRASRVDPVVTLRAL